jgi:uncharacterized membrane protein YcaP (DUF421 family)
MDLVFRAVFMYAVIYLLTRVIGRRELSSFQPFDLIMLVVIGDMVQQGVTQNDLSVTGMLVVLVTIALVQVAVSYISFRVRRLRPILDGEPIVLVQDGTPIEKNMHRERISFDDLAEAARQSQIDSLDSVKGAVLENSGSISFIQK